MAAEVNIDDTPTGEGPQSHLSTPKKPPTLEDVSRTVGVSTRTVSRVLRDEGGYSRETEDRVRAAVAELGYYPNLLARGLSGLRSGTIGLVGPSMTDPFFPELADELQRAARERGLKTFYASTFLDPTQQQDILGSLRSYGVDGVIIHAVRGSRDAVERFAASGTPTVVLDRDWSAPNLSSVSADIESGARQAVDLLIGAGRSRIAMIDGAPSHTSRRRSGYEAAIAPDAEPMVESAPPDVDGGASAMAALISRQPKLDAVFAYNDLMAFGALSVLASNARRVPDDVAIVGYDDILLARVSQPALTTINYDRRGVAAEAFDLLTNLIDRDGGATEPRTVPVEVVEREST